MTSRPSKSARSGMTLVELLVIISASTVVLSTSAVLMHQIMHTQKKSQAFFDVERSAVRLSELFRDDVHLATVAKINADAAGDIPFLELQSASGESVAYSFADGDVLRIKLREGIPAREEFAFPKGTLLDIEELDSPRRLLLSLQFAASQPPTGDGTRSPDPHLVPVYLQVEAAFDRIPQVAGKESQP